MLKSIFSRSLFIKSAAAVFAMTAITSCLGNDDVDYTDWEKRNTAYIDSCSSVIENNNKVYQTISPVWSPSVAVLMKWHNNRSLTQSRLKPLDNSTVYVKYEVEDIEGTMIDNSYSSTTYGDSIYRTRPSNNIVGFWTALTNMHIGDSVTCIIPWQAAYGEKGSGKIKPFSTLIYRLKLVDIPAYEKPYEQ